MKVGLTGGIACGKSTVSDLLVRRGAVLIDADRLAREVVEPGSPVLAEVFRMFGQDVRNEDGTLNRKKLGSIVFQDETLRKKLEEITHPAIRKLMQEQMEKAESLSPKTLIVVDVPLLYESEMDDLFDEVIVVYIPQELQLQRLMERDGLSEEEAFRRIQAQMPIEWKKELADIVIDNSGAPEETEQQIEELYKRRVLR